MRTCSIIVLPPAEEADVVEHPGQRREEDEPQARGVEDRHPAPRSRRELVVEHVEDDVLPLRHQDAAAQNTTQT